MSVGRSRSRGFAVVILIDGMMFCGHGSLWRGCISNESMAQKLDCEVPGALARDQRVLRRAHSCGKGFGAFSCAPEAQRRNAWHQRSARGIVTHASVRWPRNGARLAPPRRFPQPVGDADLTEKRVCVCVFVHVFTRACGVMKFFRRYRYRLARSKRSHFAAIGSSRPCFMVWTARQGGFTWPATCSEHPSRVEVLLSAASCSHSVDKMHARIQRFILTCAN